MLEPLFEAIPIGRSTLERVLHKYRIDRTAVICRGTRIIYRNKKTKGQLIMKKNSWVMFDCILDVTKTIHIGENAQIAPKAMIFTHDSSRSMSNPKMGEVFIDDNAYVGAGSVILPGVRIGKNAIVGAGAVVTGDVKPNMIVGGVPAKTIKILNKT
jgi:acetyltransferase-like isoleucine patch superfamily enzyme